MRFRDDKPLPIFVLTTDQVREMVTDAICKIIAEARGTCVTFTPKRVAIKANLSTKPIALAMIRDIIEDLREKGLLDLLKKTNRHYKYIITKDSPLWKKAKNNS